MSIRSPQLLTTAIVVLTVVAGVPGLESVPSAGAESDQEALREIGRIENPPSQSGYSALVGANVQRDWPAPLIVDTDKNLGFAPGKVFKNDPGFADCEPTSPGGSSCQVLAMYDLESLQLLDFVSLGAAETLFTDRLAIDEHNTRIFKMHDEEAGTPSSCSQGVILSYYEYEQVGGAGGSPGVFGPNQSVTLPCTRGVDVLFDAASIHRDPARDRTKLYVTGTYQYDESVRNQARLLGAPDTRDNDGAPLLVRQYDLDKVFSGDPDVVADSLDWQIDLRYAGCGRKNVNFVGRSGDSVFSYCHDTSGISGDRTPIGIQGYVVRIPLGANDMPVTRQTADLLPAESLPQDGADDVQESMPPEGRIPDPFDPGARGYMNAAVRRIPALPGFARPFLDPVSGRILLLTNDRTNGAAVWVMDPFAERFIGVMATGNDPAKTSAKNGAGFDPRNGRAYLFGPQGLIVGPGRQDPPLTLARHEVLDDPDDLLAFPLLGRGATPLAVVPELGRVIVPLQGQGWVVLEDTTADPPPQDREDLDRLTTQVPEEEGRTAANTLGSARASGAHVVVTGGLPRVINGADPACTAPRLGDPQNPQDPFHTVDDLVHGEDELGAGFTSPGLTERHALGGKCLGDQVLSAGDRDFELASTRAEAGTAIGVSADGQGLAFGSGDHATDRDVRNAGECLRPSAHTGSRGAFDYATQGNEDAEPLYEDGIEPFVTGDEGAYAQTCGTPQNHARERDGGASPDPTTGVNGRDGQGFPVPRANCTESSDTPVDDAAVARSDDLEAGVFHSHVECDAAQILSRATSQSAGLSLPTPGPVVTVGAATSSTLTWKSPSEGTVTVAEAAVEDVHIGPLEIGTARSYAKASAHGRQGTNHTELRREWCDVVVAGQPLQVAEGPEGQGCVDPDRDDVRALVDELNQGLQRVRVSVPTAQMTATPLGYQAIVTKHPAVRAADETVNNDDSFTVPALQVTIYNDNSEGRNRVVAQLAGVHTEARYGIVVLPDFAVPQFGDPGTFAWQPSTYVEAIDAAAFVAARPPRFGLVVQNARGELAVSEGTPERPLLSGPGGVLGALGDTFRWLMSNPREFLLLFSLFSILGIPVYQIIRRRSFERALLE